MDVQDERHDAKAVTSNGYWYPGADSNPDPVDVLNLLRRYRDAERRMRARTRDSMRMGETDLVALRFLLRATRTGKVVRQRDLAEALEISKPSVSALVDRLIRDGYVQRVAHPDDRRSVAIEPTQKTDEEVRSTLGVMHRRMLAAAESLTTEELAVVARFLTELTRSVEDVADDVDAGGEA
ncbi:MarR family transcriptional regulator [Micrococcus sp. TA1]|uniref:MarR family winged helix-turn-helix transcriptional regulator n=1 Tax=Micrococcus sp. TA1 TaxID=681627 RepID=UPI00161E4683|nr:DNA-binding MarR family transcriptional regulator [Micrococcus sp. TA1]